MSNAHRELGRHATAVRAILVALGLPQAVIGLYALFAPRSFYDDFPVGRAWVSALGPFDEHLVIDVGALFLALGVLLMLAAAWPSRRLVLAALASWLLFAVPHAVFHLTELAPYSTGDAVANALTLVWTVAGALVALALVVRGWASPASARPHPGRDVAASSVASGPPPRVPPVEERDASLLIRAALAGGRRRFGVVPAPFAITAHSPPVFFGHALFEMAAERAGRVDERLKHLAVLKAAMMAGCQWCLDFGSSLSRDYGVSDDEMRALVNYREADCFSELDRLVLDYAVAVTRTPVDVSDELVARLREHFDDGQLVELTANLALENYRARFNWALGIESQGFSEGAYCVVPEPQAAAR